MCYTPGKVIIIYPFTGLLLHFMKQFNTIGATTKKTVSDIQSVGNVKLLHKVLDFYILADLLIPVTLPHGNYIVP